MEHEPPIELPCEMSVGSRTIRGLKLKRFSPYESAALRQAAIDRKIARGEATFRRLKKSDDDVISLAAELLSKPLSGTDLNEAASDPEVQLDCMFEAAAPYNDGMNRGGLKAWLGGGAEKIGYWFWLWFKLSRNEPDGEKKPEGGAVAGGEQSSDPTDPSGAIS